VKKAFAYLICFILLSNPGSIIRSLAMFMTYFTEEKQSAEVYIIFSFLFNFFRALAFVGLSNIRQRACKLPPARKVTVGGKTET